MLIDNYDILDTLEEHAEVNEEGKKFWFLCKSY